MTIIGNSQQPSSRPALFRRTNVQVNPPANVASDQQELIDSVALNRADLDPLANLERSLPQAAKGASPLPRRLPKDRGDDELAGIFDDSADTEDAPSLLDPVRKPPDDPLALLDQTAQLKPAGKAADAEIPPPADKAITPNLNAVPSSRPGTPIIPENWDPGLLLAARPSSMPLQQQLPQSSAEGSDPGVRDSVVLLRQREAARQTSGRAVSNDHGHAGGTLRAINFGASRPGPAMSFGTAAMGVDGKAASPGEPVIGEALEDLCRALGVDPSRVSPGDQRRMLAASAQSIRGVVDGLIQIITAQQHLMDTARDTDNLAAEDRTVAALDVPALDRTGQNPSRPSLFGTAPPPIGHNSQTLANEGMANEKSISQESAGDAPDGEEPDSECSGASNDATGVIWGALGIDPSRMTEPERDRLLVEIGRTVRQVADNLIPILAARQHLKSEFRVDQTMVRASENNMFKFTRNADELLSLAMANRNRAFLPLDQAVLEAFNDIKAHEMATLSAVQLSIGAVLDRFQPAKLEQQATGKRRWLDRFSFRSRKSRYWDFYARMYADLSSDAGKASSRIFTTEFGRAYREQIEKQKAR